MQGGIARLLAGAALAVGGGIAGAALVGQEPAQGPVAPAVGTELAAAQAEKVQRSQATRALRTARQARRIARRARSKSNQSLATANAMLEEVDKALADSATALAASQQAENDAANALQAANTANSRLDTTQIVSDSQNGLVQSADEDSYESLGGPQVTVTVPASGMIELWATVTFGDDGNNSVAADGAVALFQDGQLVTQVDEENLCSSFSGSGLTNMLLASGGPAGAEIPLSTPGAVEVFTGGCGVIGGTPGSILLNASPGQHTYELRYGDCGCETEPAGFKNRTLRIAPRL